MNPPSSFTHIEVRPDDARDAERLPLALCCDDPSAVRWRTVRAARQRWPLYWGPAPEGPAPAGMPAADKAQPVSGTEN